jgi:hypothetical protein
MPQHPPRICLKPRYDGLPLSLRVEFVRLVRVKRTCLVGVGQVLDSDGHGELGYESLREGLRKMRVVPVMHLSHVRLSLAPPPFSRPLSPFLFPFPSPSLLPYHLSRPIIPAKCPLAILSHTLDANSEARYLLPVHSGSCNHPPTSASPGRLGRGHGGPSAMQPPGGARGGRISSSAPTPAAPLSPAPDGSSKHDPKCPRLLP